MQQTYRYIIRLTVYHMQSQHSQVAKSAHSGRDGRLEYQAAGPHGRLHVRFISRRTTLAAAWPPLPIP